MVELSIENLVQGQIIIEQISEFVSLLLQEFKFKIECVCEVVEIVVWIFVEYVLEQISLIFNDVIKLIELIIVVFDVKFIVQVNLIMYYVDFQ